MAKYAGFAMIAAAFFLLFTASAYKTGWLLALALWTASVSAGVLVAYGIGLAVTGDWRCYRDLLP